MSGEEAPQRGDAGAHTTLGQHHLQLCQCRIGLLLDRLQDESRMVLHLGGSTITAPRLRRWRAMSEHQLLPPDRARRADAEPLGRSPARQPTINGSDHTIPKITR